MGYTHYWYVNLNVEQTKLDSIKNDAKEILSHGFKEGVLGDGNGQSCSFFELIDDKRIRFNGLGEDSHETFYFHLNSKKIQKEAKDGYQPNEEQLFSFTKTNHKPYDKYVVMILSVIKSHLGEDIEISSDGGDEVFTEMYEQVLHLLNKKEFKNKVKKL